MTVKKANKQPFMVACWPLPMHRQMIVYRAAPGGNSHLHWAIIVFALITGIIIMNVAGIAALAIGHRVCAAAFLLLLVVLFVHSWHQERKVIATALRQVYETQKPVLPFEGKAGFLSGKQGRRLCVAENTAAWYHESIKLK